MSVQELFAASTIDNAANVEGEVSAYAVTASTADSYANYGWGPGTSAR